MSEQQPKNCDWIVTLRTKSTSETVRAAYHRFATNENFIEFKDDEHRLVYTVSAHDAISIRRA